MGEITRLLIPANGSEPDLDEVFERLYPELRRIAQGRLSALQHGQTLTPTVVVAEAYVKLVHADSLDLRSRRHFFACAARAMRMLIIDHLRTSSRQKRGGGVQVMTLHEELLALLNDTERLLDLDSALNELDRMSPQQRELIELKFFAGLTTQEIAELMDVSPRTVARDWNSAKAFLHARLAR